MSGALIEEKKFAKDHNAALGAVAEQDSYCPECEGPRGMHKSWCACNCTTEEHEG